MTAQALRRWETIIAMVKGAAGSPGEAALLHLARAVDTSQNEGTSLAVIKKLVQKEVCRLGRCRNIKYYNYRQLT